MKKNLLLIIFISTLEIGISEANEVEIGIDIPICLHCSLCNENSHSPSSYFVIQNEEYYGIFILINIACESGCSNCFSVQVESNTKQCIDNELSSKTCTLSCNAGYFLTNEGCKSMFFF